MLAIFPDITGPLSDETTRRRSTSSIAAASRSRRWPSGICRTKTSIYRVINEMRAQRIMELPLDFIPNPPFASAERREGDPGRDARRATRRPRRPGCPAGLPPYLASLYEVPLLTREQEAHLFRKFNYLKYKAAQAARRARSGAAQEQRDGRDRAALRRGRGDEEPDRPRQPAAGGFDRQAARRPGATTSSSW